MAASELDGVEQRQEGFARWRAEIEQGTEGHDEPFPTLLLHASKAQHGSDEAGAASRRLA